MSIFPLFRELGEAKRKRRRLTRRIVIRQKRSDTIVSSIEKTYDIDLHARSDMTLGSLLYERRFESLSQLLKAYRGQLDYHASSRRVFLSFHRDDLQQVHGFRLMMANDHVDLDISDELNRYAVGSERSGYIKQVLRERISRVDIVICMIGNGTAWREWVDWELTTAMQARRGICGVRLKGSRGRVPEILREIDAPIAQWNLNSIRRAIECAAARRS
jgi:antiphage defense system Thoeris ThsB-like protein